MPLKSPALASIWLFSCLIGGVAEAQTVTRGPYLQNGSPTATTVRWRTSSATESVVRYGTSAGALTLTASDSTLRTEHEIRLTGLAPNTTYYYSVGNLAATLAGGSDYFVVTAPTSAKPTRIWVLGDAGTGTSVQTTVRDAYYAFTGARHTDLWLMLGDNAYNSGTDAEYQTRMFDIYPAMFRKSVLWTTLGNHDAASASSSSQTGPYYDLATLPKAGEAGGVASGTEAYYSFDYGNIHFVCLDSQGSSRSATGAQAAWLTADLQNNTRDWLVAFFHHPPYSKGSHNSDTDTIMTEMRMNFLPILENYGVDLVLTGHSHSYERSRFIDGHYGVSSTFDSATMVKQAGGGQGSGAYTKASLTPTPHQGTVYAVAGASGQTSGGTLNHPAMFISLNVAGSLVLDVNGPRLDATYLDNAGVTRDSFSMQKGAAANVPPTVSITSPSNNTSVPAPANFTIAASAADTDGFVTQVAFYQGATLLGTDTAAPYQFSWNGVTAGTYSLTAVATDNSGGVTTSAPISVTVTPGSGATVVTLQQGLNGYSGMTDTTIRSSNTSTNYGSDVTLLADGDPDYAILLRWDLTPIPAGKTITAATITFNVVDLSSQVYELYALKRAWSESGATWSHAAPGTKWQKAGASGNSDRESTVLGTLTASAVGAKSITLNAAGLAKLQAWINSPSSNDGFVLQDFANTDGVDLSSSEDATVGLRPALTITYQ